MANEEGGDLYSEALAAGAARDYRTSISLLTALLAAGEAPVEALLYLGRSHHALGSFGRAVDSFRAYLRAGGERGAGLFFLGRTLLAAGLAQEAARSLHEAAELMPRRAGTWALLGAAELKLRRSAQAVDHLETAVNLAPEDKRIYRGYLNALFVRGVRSLQRGDADLAAQALGFVIDNGLDSTATRLWRARAFKELGRFPEALRECSAAEAWSPADTSIGWLKAGLLLSSGRKDEALRLAGRLGHPAGLEGAAQGDGASFELLRAANAFQAERWRESLEASSAALRSGGGLPPKARAGLHALAAESLRMLGHLERARTEAEKAVEADASSPELRTALALVLFDLGEFAASLGAAEEARDLGADPGSVDYIADLCKARLGDASADTLARLQASLRRRARSGEAPDPRLFFALGESLYRAERPDLASTWFEKVLELDPGHELALLYRISVAESLGDREGELEASAAYLAVYPDNHVIRRDQAEALAAAEDWPAVATVLEEGLAYAEPSPGARRLLARAWRETERFREAAVMYRDLLLATPEDGELLMALCLCLSRDGKTEYALALLDKAPRAALERAGPWIVKGLLAERQGRIETSIDAYRRATELEPRLERPWRELSRIYSSRGLLAFAEEAEARLAALEAARGPKSRKRAPSPAGAGAGPVAAPGEIPRPRRPRRP